MSAATDPIEVYVEGVALWAPRLPGWPIARRVLRGEAELPTEIARRPQPAVLAPTERRRAPDTVSIALEVAQRACEAAGREPGSLASVFASTHGDLVISDYMCAALTEAEPAISPTRFHNSVHNAAAGYWTIGTGCMAPATALSAFRDTFATALLEALSQVRCDGAPVLLVSYDIEATGPLASVNQSRGLLGIGLVLAPDAGAHATHRVAARMVARRDDDAERVPAAASAAVAGSPLAGALALFEALAREQPTTCRLPLSRGLALELAVSAA